MEDFYIFRGVKPCGYTSRDVTCVLVDLSSSSCDSFWLRRANVVLAETIKLDQLISERLLFLAASRSPSFLCRNRSEQYLSGV